MENLSERNLIILIITRYIARVFFNKDRFKAIHFMRTANIHFLGKTPHEMIIEGRSDQVWSWIESRQYDLGETD